MNMNPYATGGIAMINLETIAYAASAAAFVSAGAAVYFRGKANDLRYKLSHLSVTPNLVTQRVTGVDGTPRDVKVTQVYTENPRGQEELVASMVDPGEAGVNPEQLGLNPNRERSVSHLLEIVDRYFKAQRRDLHARGRNMDAVISDAAYQATPTPPEPRSVPLV